MSGSNFSCGIDFGTSNSTCAIFNGEDVSLVSLEADNQVIPSALFFSAEGRVCFGREAVKSYIEGEEGRLLRGLKSVLGTSLMSERTVAGNKSRTFEGILSVYIGNLKTKAEEHAGAPLTRVVMGRPVHFHDNDPDADALSEDVLRRISTQLGFEDISFQYEPIAAAYAHEQNIQEETLALVVDLGGGTSDFTVIRLSPERATSVDRRGDILATSGVRVGGTDFDKLLSVSAFMPFLGLGSQCHTDFDKSKVMEVPSRVFHDLSDWPLIHQAQSRKAIDDTRALLRNAEEPHKIERLLELQEEQLGHALLQMVEKTKIGLTGAQEWVADLCEIGLDFSVSVTRDVFLHSISSRISKIEFSMEECLNLAGVEHADVGLVILTGGSSELPVINAMVQDKFLGAKISKDDKFGSVGRGLAYNAARLYGASRI